MKSEHEAPFPLAGSPMVQMPRPQRMVPEWNSGTPGKTPPLRIIIRTVLFLIATVSIGNYHPLLMPSDSELMQQAVTLTLWLALIALSWFPGALRTKERTGGLLWPGIMLLYIIVSPLWSFDPSAGFMKSTAFLIVALGAWRAALMVTTEEFFDCMLHSLTLLAFASAALAVFVPDIGVTHDWQHDGQWNGIFPQKQVLGISCAFLVFLSLLRLTRKWTLFNGAALLIGLLCLLASGSRGGAVIAVISVCSLFAARKYRIVMSVLVSVVGIELALANLAIFWLAYTGNAYIDIFGLQTDLTSRTFIWQYSLGYWLTKPFLGYGLNGFWTDADIYNRFLIGHNWVLDNFHSGYVAIIVETGLIGMTLFSIVVFHIIYRLKLIADLASPKRATLEMAIGTLILLFTINFTETFFLRSTSFFSVTFAFLVIKILSTSTRRSFANIRAAPSPAPVPGASQMLPGQAGSHSAFPGLGSGGASSREFQR
ncbi:O-antigen ligase family protein [Rhodovastum atsumiense]|uniref:O-antigen ligase family protein n=1 Tax=Rhodovastum atsumiense TaxID=504468 RepID=A0A5M6J4S7_9PROT|nr:O-antigen ligase family protein [Rhodovastum atsumiense]KAA5614635.1 O-antigen ligase family protein [Rhodovastum atsumiense]CAH2599850.1 O-antigen ligase family protein [Rhodovastum atsumiense]